MHNWRCKRKFQNILTIEIQLMKLAGRTLALLILTRDCRVIAELRVLSGPCGAQAEDSNFLSVMPPRCWERLRARGEGDDRGRDGWMASLDSVDMNLSKVRGDGEGQGGLAWCRPWGYRELDSAYWMNNKASNKQVEPTSHIKMVIIHESHPFNFTISCFPHEPMLFCFLLTNGQYMCFTFYPILKSSFPP